MIDSKPIEPAAGLVEQYRELHKLCGQILELTLTGEYGRLHARSHNYLEDLGKWIDVISHRPECDILRTAVQEYQRGLLALAQGQYRQAFMALRTLLESGLATVGFSGSEFDFRTWMRGERDINWNSLIDTDNGIFTKRFVLAFFDDESVVDEAKHYRALAAKVYRECSEYIHGNADTIQTIPSELVFDSDTVTTWHSKADSIRLVMTFSLTLRYLDHIKLDSRLPLESIVLDQLGHLAPVRSRFGGVTT